MRDPSCELPPGNPTPRDEGLGNDSNRIVALTVHVELPPDSPPEHDATLVLRALHHATREDISDHVGSSETSASLGIPERPSVNPNLMRAPTTDALTPHQVRVASLIAFMTNPEVGERLGISENAVKSAIKEIYRRLKVHDRVAATAKTLGFLGAQEEADDYWAGGSVSGEVAPAVLSPSPPRLILQARQREILREIFNGATVNTLTRDFDTSLDSMRTSIRSILRRLGLKEDVGVRDLQQYLRENVTAFEFLQAERP